MAVKKEEREVSNQLPLEDQNDAFEHLMEALEDVGAANDEDGDIYATSFDGMQELPDELENELASLLDSELPDDADDEFSALMAETGDSVDGLLESFDDEPLTPARSGPRVEAQIADALANSDDVDGEDWSATDDVDTELMVEEPAEAITEIDVEIESEVEEFELPDEVEEVVASAPEEPAEELPKAEPEKAEVAADMLLEDDSEVLEVRGFDTGAFESTVSKTAETAEVDLSAAGLNGSLDLGPETIEPAPVSASTVNYELPEAKEESVEPIKVADTLLPPRAVTKPSAAGGTVNFLGLVAGLVGVAFGAIAVGTVTSVNDELAELKQSIAQVNSDMAARNQEMNDLRRSANSATMLESTLGDMGNQVEAVRDEVVAVRSDFMHQSELMTAAFGRLQKVENDLADTQVDVAAQGEKVTTLSEEVTVLATKPVVVKSAKAVTVTKPSAPAPVAAKTDGWAINLGTYGQKAQAALEARRFQQSGVDAVVSAAGAGKFRIQVVGFADYASAKSAVADIQQRTGVNGAWVGRVN